MAMNFSVTWYELQVMKPVSFVNVEPKECQSSGCTYINQTSKRSLNKHCWPARKLMVTVFWNRKGVLMVEFMQQGTTMSQVYCVQY
jgi:hypothetical protein